MQTEAEWMWDPILGSVWVVGGEASRMVYGVEGNQRVCEDEDEGRRGSRGYLRGGRRA